MTPLPTPSMTFEMPAPKRRKRKPDPYRYLKRMGDKQRSVERLAELQERSIKVELAERKWTELRVWKRAALTIMGETPVSYFEGRV